MSPNEGDDYRQLSAASCYASLEITPLRRKRRKARSPLKRDYFDFFIAVRELRLNQGGV
ncbi:hypothetical protein [Escherichia coli]|uniref:hypothetical protein n=1 Tax=Escherichia coli TaxID=562 RepID=UPI0030C8861D